jgi:hypothetical protein
MSERTRGYDNNNTVAAATLIGCNAAAAAGFEDYLIAQRRRNVKQVVCYAKKYRSVLETGDATAIVNLQSGAIRRHAMEALTALSKYAGSYDKWQEIRKHYSLKWTNGDESLQSLQRFFNPDLSLDVMLQRIREMIRLLPHLWVKSSSLRV